MEPILQTKQNQKICEEWLKGDSKMTYAELGRRHGISRQRVHQIITKMTISRKEWPKYIAAADRVKRYKNKLMFKNFWKELSRLK